MSKTIGTLRSISESVARTTQRALPHFFDRNNAYLPKENIPASNLLHQSIMSQNSSTITDEMTKSRIRTAIDKIDRKAAQRIHSMNKDNRLVFPDKGLSKSPKNVAFMQK